MQYILQRTILLSAAIHKVDLPHADPEKCMLSMVKRRQVRIYLHHSPPVIMDACLFSLKDEVLDIDLDHIIMTSAKVCMLVVEIV